MYSNSVLFRQRDGKIFTVKNLAHWSDIVSEDGEADSVKLYGHENNHELLVGATSGHSYRCPMRGWIFTLDGSEEIVGFAEPHEYRDAEHAVQGFSRECPDEFSVYFRDSSGEWHQCSAESKPEDFN